ncbi:hypothetical protein O9992_10925 [Vibrio lentus]|nr:hypothetical protein [Vibrio lentus]
MISRYMPINSTALAFWYNLRQQNREAKKVLNLTVCLITLQSRKIAVKRDWIGGFAVIGIGERVFADEYKAKGDDYKRNYDSGGC